MMRFRRFRLAGRADRKRAWIERHTTPTSARMLGVDISLSFGSIAMKLTLFGTVALGMAAACSASGGGNNGTISGGQIEPDGTGGVGNFIDASSGATGTVDPNDNRQMPVREKTCDANGQNCYCLRLAVLGTLDSAAAAKDTTPFQNWLNGNSDGTANVTMVSVKPVVDAAFLAQYDILLVANVNNWTFSQDEKDA